jgi:hypothetical protein
MKVAQISLSDLEITLNILGFYSAYSCLLFYLLFTLCSNRKWLNEDILHVFSPCLCANYFFMILARNPVKTNSLSLVGYGKFAMKATKQWLNSEHAFQSFIYTLAEHCA